MTIHECNLQRSPPLPILYTHIRTVVKQEPHHITITTLRRRTKTIPNLVKISLIQIFSIRKTPMPRMVWEPGKFAWREFKRKIVVIGCCRGVVSLRCVQKGRVLVCIVASCWHGSTWAHLKNPIASLLESFRIRQPAESAREINPGRIDKT